MKTLGDLKVANYKTRNVREEIRQNLVHKIEQKENIFPGIFGYDQTVIPDIERALLSGHNILLLGLRGQAKTRLARMMVNLLDEYIPVIEGSEINDDPFFPISKFGKEALEKSGDKTPIRWIHRSERYVEKLATPDVSIADLIGDMDPIKAAQKNISYDNENALHYGLIPRSHRGIFVINELPDLQARIQVALFNILEENDLQIRGFKFKLPLDVFFVFTANPEDYTHRGNIITPLKDRIESQILTHYPENIETSLKISLQEAQIPDSLKKQIIIPELMLRIVEGIAFIARESDLVDDKSGVSARLSISAFELLYHAIYRRMLINGEKKGFARLADLLSVVPALTGKIELAYEGEQMGAYDVALSLINDSILNQCEKMFPTVNTKAKQKDANPYQPICDWFSKGNSVILGLDDPEDEYQKIIHTVPGASNLIHGFNKKEHTLATECILHHLSSANLIQREWLDQRIVFKDQLASMLNDLDLSAN